MNRILLYYPSISFPNKYWLYKAVFYSDAIATIVPFEDITDKNWKISDTVKYLFDEDEYKPYFIRKHISKHREEFRNYLEIYDKFVRSSEYQKLSSKKVFTQINPNHNYAILHNTYSSRYSSYLLEAVNGAVIRRNKIRSINEFDDLTKLEAYLYDGSSSSPVILIEKVAGAFYMQLLSQFIANTDENLITPFTHDKFYEQIAFEIADPSQYALKLLLDRCLPTPSINTPIKKVVQFKHKRKSELIKLRKTLNDIQHTIGKANSPQEVKEVLIDFKEALQIDALTVNKVLKDEKINFAWESISSLFGLENPSLFNAMIASGIIATPINPSIGLGIGTIGVVGQLVTKYIQINKRADDATLAYLLLAKREKLIK